MRFIGIILLFILVSCDNVGNEVMEDVAENRVATLSYKEITGVNSNLLSLDIYYNDTIEVKKPVVIWVHGGGWAIGDKANSIGDKVRLFQSLNYVFVSINYRLSPFPLELNNPDRIMYPVHNDDVADAIRWVYDQIGGFGGDREKIALIGHSAGAHLVSLIGTNKLFLESVGLSLNNIRGVASIDTRGYNVVEQVSNNENLYINAFGVNEESNREASPIFNVNDGIDYPQFFIAKRGDSDRIVTANAFIDALNSSGATVFQVDGSIYNHTGINHAIGAPNETLITNTLVEFFENCFE